MPDNSIKFIASDMDGTLLDEHGSLPGAFYSIFEKLAQQQVIFAAASGRQYYSLLQTFEPIKDRMMFIAENGTLVMHQGKELYSSTIPKAEIDTIIRITRSIAGCAIVLCGKQSAYIETQDPQVLDEVKKYYHRCEYVDDLLTVNDQFIKVAILNFSGTEQNVYPSLNQHFGDTHQVVVSAKIWLDIMHKTASKGTAIRYLQDTLGFTFQQTISFGDYLNDYEMLEASYYSYAMQNAHPEIKRIARFDAPSNAEHGVIKVLESVVLSK